MFPEESDPGINHRSRGLDGKSAVVGRYQGSDVAIVPPVTVGEGGGIGEGGGMNGEGRRRMKNGLVGRGGGEL